MSAMVMALVVSLLLVPAIAGLASAAGPQAYLQSVSLPSGRVFYADEAPRIGVMLRFDEEVNAAGLALAYELVDITTEKRVLRETEALEQVSGSVVRAEIAPDLPSTDGIAWFRLSLAVVVDGEEVAVMDGFERQRPAAIAFGKVFDAPQAAGAASRVSEADSLAAENPPANPSRKVMAFYYPWYGNPDTSRTWLHWPEGGHDPSRFDAQGLPPIGASFHPVLGAYDSRDPRVIEQHLAWAEEAGIDVLIVSWWGRGHVTDVALGQLLDLAKETSVQVAFYYEDVPGERPEAFVSDILYLLDRYGDHPATFKHDGAPVVFIYDRAVSELSYGDWQRILPQIKAERDVLFIADREDRAWASLFDGLHSYNPIGRIAGGASPQSLFDAIVWEAESMGKISAVVVLPGYDDTNIGRANPIPVSRRDGALYDELWEAAITALPQWVVITSFNEWHEGSQIEPSLDHGDYYIRRTAEWADRFRTVPERTFWVEERSLPEVVRPGQSVPIVVKLRRIVPGEVDVTWDLPSGWTYEGGRPVALGPTVIVSGNLVVPESAEAGRYPLTVRVSLGEYSVQLAGTATVPEQGAAPPFDGVGVWTMLGEPNLDFGIRQKDDADGVTEAVEIDGVWARKTVRGVSDNKYMYFDVADSFLFNVPSGIDVELGIQYLDRGTGTIWVQYDSHNPAGALNGAYTDALAFDLTDSGEWKWITIPLRDVRFGNRQNAATDFRFGAGTGEFIVRQVYIKRME